MAPRSITPGHVTYSREPNRNDKILDFPFLRQSYRGVGGAERARTFSCVTAHSADKKEKKKRQKEKRRKSGSGGKCQSVKASVATATALLTAAS